MVSKPNSLLLLVGLVSIFFLLLLTLFSYGNLDNSTGRETPEAAIQQSPLPTCCQNPVTESPSMLLATKDPTITPLPMTSAEDWATLMSLQSACEALCILGITPGLTSEDELWESLQRFGRLSSYISQDGAKHIILEALVEITPGAPEIMGAHFTVYESAIREVFTSGSVAFMESDLSNILMQLGKPPSIIIVRYSTDSQIPPGTYKLDIVYESLGLTLRKTGLLTGDSNSIALCPNIRDESFLHWGVHVWDSEDFATNTRIQSELTTTLPWEILYDGIDTEVFFAIFLEGDEHTCVEIP